ncbi:hypothetical protein WJX73_008642 [Symbiochloris irregularis]|uniref:Uncharacterized protein n=1 Tax=Symbiochloris irregularis TaxID=706552 RepID=A0AAW1NVP6_9CHLO
MVRATSTKAHSPPILPARIFLRASNRRSKTPWTAARPGREGWRGVSQAAAAVHQSASLSYARSRSALQQTEWHWLKERGIEVNPCNSKLHPAVVCGAFEVAEGSQEVSVQEAYTPNNACYGCGPAAVEEALHLRSFRADNAIALMDRLRLPRPPLTLTAELLVQFMEPTPPNQELILSSKVVDISTYGEESNRKESVESDLPRISEASMSEHVDPHKLLNPLPANGLPHLHAVLLERSGRRQKALRCIWRAATQSTRSTQPSSSSQTVRAGGKVARLLSRKHDRIDPLQALGLLPDQVSLKVVLPFLKGALRAPGEQQRNAAVAKSLHLHLREEITCSKQRQERDSSAHSSSPPDSVYGISG